MHRLSIIQTKQNIVFLTCTLGMDPCMNDNGGCDQRCVNYGGRAVCQCYAGWSLAADGRKCEGRIIRIIVNRLLFPIDENSKRLIMEKQVKLTA